MHTTGFLKNFWYSCEQMMDLVKFETIFVSCIHYLPTYTISSNVKSCTILLFICNTYLYVIRMSNRKIH